MDDFKALNIALTIVVVVLFLLPGVHLAIGGLWLLGVAGLWIVYFIKKVEDRERP